MSDKKKTKKTLEELLNKERESLRRLEVRDLEQPQRATSGDLSSYDNHPAELGSETYDREFSITLRDRLAIHVSRITRALEKLDEDTYGICDDCGAQIPEGRLEALPEATLCVKDQSQRDRSYASKEVGDKVFPYDPEFQSEMPEGT